MLDIVLLLAVLAALLVVVAVSQPVAVRLKLAPVVLLAVIGVAIGAASSVLLHTPVTHRFDSIAALFADLPVELGDLHLRLPAASGVRGRDHHRCAADARGRGADPDARRSRDGGRQPRVVGVALWPVAGLPLVVCLLLGSVVATTDPAAVIAVFRDVGAPARLTRLVEGEALLNDAAAIVHVRGAPRHDRVRAPARYLGGAVEFVVSFLGGGDLGVAGGPGPAPAHPLDAETIGSPKRRSRSRFPISSSSSPSTFFHVSGVVAVLSAGLTVSASGRSRITPYNWSFITDLWAQIAFWAHSLVFVLASILVPKLLLDMHFHDLVLIAVLIVGGFRRRASWCCSCCCRC